MKDVIVIGGGAAGLAVAIEIKSKGHDVFLIEREKELGGILNQCIHNGFGLDVFKEEYTGPEYAHRFIENFKNMSIDYCLDTTVLDLKKDGDQFLVKASSLKKGIQTYQAKAIVLSTGSYERTRGQISIPGDRPYGVLTAGSAQRYLNIDGYMVGKKAFILGSGDIGLIMARRMTLEGAKVLGVAEIMPYSNGLNRNIVQCLNDFDIPLYLSHTVTHIESDDHHRLKRITVSQVDEGLKVIPGTEKVFDVDTLLLSIGLIPDITLLDHLNVEIDARTKSVKVNQANETSLKGLFVCGNALQIHDLVDYVTKESRRTGDAVHKYLENRHRSSSLVSVKALDHISYITPQYIDIYQDMDDIVMSYRAKEKIEKAQIIIKQGEDIIYTKKKMFLVPAEMETINLNSAMIKKDQDITVSIEVI